MHFLLKFHRLRGLECFEGSTMKKLVRPVVFNEDIISIFGLKMCQIDTENMTKIPKTSNFQRFMHFFQIFDRLRQLEKLKRFNKENECCLVCLEKR